jgi:hypothetical protein
MRIPPTINPELNIEAAPLTPRSLSLNQGDRDMAASTDENITMEARIPQTQATIIIFFLTTISNSV